MSRGLTPQSTLYRSFRGQFLQVRWTSQRCQSTEGSRLTTETGFSPTRTGHSTVAGLDHSTSATGRQRTESWCCSSLLFNLFSVELLFTCASYIHSQERSLLSQGYGLGLDLETHQRLVSVSAIYVSCPRRYFRPNYASHINKMSQICSRYLCQC